MSQSEWTKTDRKFMQEAFKEAEKVRGLTLPNPPVGAVLVKAGKIISRGGTGPAGGPHAEAVALKRAASRSKDSTLYVTLEPCCHHGRTPPCVSGIITGKVKRIVISMKDSDKQVNGRGIKQLKKAGIKAEVGLLKEKAEEFYKHYNFFIHFNRPKVYLKIAQSLDGSINEMPGKRTAITGPEARKITHDLRNMVDAVIIGARTFRIDNPDLSPRTVKTGRKHYPDAVILTRSGKLPVSHRLFKANRRSKCLVISTKRAKTPKWVDLKVIPKKNPEIEDIISILKRRGCHSVLIEGGAEVLGQWLKSGLWDEFLIFTGSKILPKGLKWSCELPANWQESLKVGKFCQIGKDTVLTVYPKKAKRQ
jgi:diaminohydroxyphosphoribosylaminopyrimidine deaminase/5-amino-6-(5-phosphoribosylamino)uracil reductase